MDSKMRKTVIMAVIIALLAIVAAVVFANLNTIQKRLNRITRGENPQAEAVAKTATESDLSAFTQDETFFDPLDNQYDALENKGQRLDIMVTSVEKDLRIKIVNVLGEPVMGQNFYVNVNDTPYEDQDRDGMIYIDHMEAGEYYVSMEPMEGYTIPNTKVKVAVKNQVDYKVIDDISYLVKTEDEINVELEDTEQDVDAEDVDGSELTEAVHTDESTFGIDVSKWNKDIDWVKVKEAGVDFAIIRCGYRGASTGSLVEDPYFARNIQGAAEAGVQIGLYFFTQAVNEVEAVEEASTAIMLCDNYNLNYPIFIDTEGAGGSGRADTLDKDTRTRVCEAFCQTIESAGYTGGVYASKNWYNRNLDASQLERYVLWLAEYKAAPTYEGEYQIWQYSSKGAIDGIEGHVDLNISLLNK
ncbi:MAG: glycoside hydrolase family 25 protein [Lachnospiraceae bacterium]|nr:glycoside hydrolase family 25 protein [Lachnospiraceae bacterium]